MAVIAAAAASQANSTRPRSLPTAPSAAIGASAAVSHSAPNATGWNSLRQR